MAKIRKRKIHWTPSPAMDVAGYKLYWTEGDEVTYDSDFAEVGNVTEVVLPDDIPSFPVAGNGIKLGVTAINEIGNESDMITFSASSEFKVPDSPLDLAMETIQDYYIYHRSEESGRSEMEEATNAPETEEKYQEGWGEM